MRWLRDVIDRLVGRRVVLSEEVLGTKDMLAAVRLRRQHIFDERIRIQAAAAQERVRGN